MSNFIPWNSQSLEAWTNEYAEGKIIQLNGLQTHYLEMGEERAGRAPIILLHGFFYDSLMWYKNMQFLSQHYKVYALDLWGFGYSAREPLDYGYPLFAEQIQLFMQALNISKASFIGHSLGAGAAITFVGEHADKVEKLILVDAFGLPNSAPLYSRLIKTAFIGPLLLKLKNDSLRKKILSCHLNKNGNITDEDYLSKATWSQKIFGSNQVIIDIEQRQFFDQLSDEIHHLSDFDLPTLMIWGKQDRIVPFTRGEHMQKVMLGSKLEIIDNAGHLVNIDQPEIFEQTALRFLQMGELKPVEENALDTKNVALHTN